MFQSKNIRVLVVDDAESMRKVLVSIIKSFGINHIFEANNGASALNIINEKELDVIICDWEMPKMNGLELFIEVQKQKNPPPFVLVTSNAEIDKVKNAVDKGVKHYIVKPIKPDTISKKLSSLFPDAVNNSV